MVKLVSVFSIVIGSAISIAGTPRCFTFVQNMSAGYPKRHVDYEDFISGLKRPSGTKIEVGGNINPLVPEFIQVEKFRSTAEFILNQKLDLSFEYRTAKIHNLSRSEFSERLGEQRKEGDVLFAAARAGLIADAQRLPFGDNSIAVILTKNFSWKKQDEETREFIRRVLSEYKRVLVSGGQIVTLNSISLPRQNMREFLPNFEDLKRRAELLLEDQSEDQARILDYHRLHIDVAEELGLKVELIPAMATSSGNQIGLHGLRFIKP